MFDKKIGYSKKNDRITVENLCDYSLRDTMECGQCFRAVSLPDELKHDKSENYCEYMTVIGDNLVFVGQNDLSRLDFFETDEQTLIDVLIPYFSLDRDYSEIRDDVKKHTDSHFLTEAADLAKGIRILRQDPWEALLSFIISQNNNIPRIKKIVGAISYHYGKNLAALRLGRCPLGKCESKGEKGSEFDTASCVGCGACYSFPTCDDIISDPDGLLPSHPGFRYKYMIDAAVAVSSGKVDFNDIILHGSYLYTKDSLMKIKGVGEKVASCVALFAFDNLDAFPVDVWMKRAIDTYFGGNLDPSSLGKYAGVAQQYIFHMIRNLDTKE